MMRAIFDLDRPVRQEFLYVLHRLTEGNPFFIEEVLKSLVVAGDIFYGERGWDRKPLRVVGDVCALAPDSVDDAGPLQVLECPHRGDPADAVCASELLFRRNAIAAAQGAFADLVDHVRIQALVKEVAILAHGR